MNQRLEPALYDAIIVGAGHNGLVCAGYLARSGLNILVLERRHVVGGACVSEEIFPGYMVSTCSYVAYILQDKIVRDLDLHRFGFKVHPLPIKRFFPFPDGRSLTFWNDTERTSRQIADTFTAKDAEGYIAIQAFWDHAGSLFNRYFLTEPPTLETLQAAVKGTKDAEMLDRLLNGSLADMVDELFESDEVKSAAVSHVMAGNGLDERGLMFAYAATKPGAFVDRANQGIVVGGMGTISQSMARSAKAAGAKLRCGAEVARILIEEGRACGVELIDGQVIRSQRVISNADPKRTFLGLVGEGNLESDVVRSIKRLETRHATLKFHAAVSELPDFSRYLGPGFDPQLIATIGIGPSMSYFRQSIQDARDGKMTDCPVIDVQIPTVYDRTVAPPGKHIVSMWVRFVPVTPKGTTWELLRTSIGHQLIDLMTEYAPNFRKSLIDWLVYTPVDIESRVYLTDGNFRHTDHIGAQLLGHRLFSRGGYRTPVPDLYMCGAGTHPGGDVSGAPGHNAAQAILSDIREIEGEHN